MITLGSVTEPITTDTLDIPVSWEAPSTAPIKWAVSDLHGYYVTGEIVDPSPGVIHVEGLQALYATQLRVEVHSLDDYSDFQFQYYQLDAQDYVPPTVTLETVGGNLAGQPVTFTYSWIQGSFPVIAGTLMVGNQPYYPTGEPSSPDSFTVNGLDEGTYQVEVLLNDGWQSTSSATTPGSITEITILSSTAINMLSGPPASTDLTDATITWEAVSGFAGVYQLSLDGVSSTTTDTSVQYTDLEPGYHNFTVSAMTASGLILTGQWNWLVTTTQVPLPTLQVDGIITRSPTLAVVITTDATQPVFSYRLNDGAWVALADEVLELTANVSADVSVSVRVFDQNTGLTSQVQTFVWQARVQQPEDLVDTKLEMGFMSRNPVTGEDRFIPTIPLTHNSAWFSETLDGQFKLPAKRVSPVALAGVSGEFYPRAMLWEPYDLSFSVEISDLAQAATGGIGDRATFWANHRRFVVQLQRYRLAFRYTKFDGSTRVIEGELLNEVEFTQFSQDELESSERVEFEVRFSTPWRSEHRVSQTFAKRNQPGPVIFRADKFEGAEAEITDALVILNGSNPMLIDQRSGDRVWYDGSVENGRVDFGRKTMQNGNKGKYRFVRRGFAFRLSPMDLKGPKVTVDGGPNASVTITAYLRYMTP